MDDNESEVELGEDEYVVAGIKDHKFVPENRRTEYLVHWQGYGSDEDSWIPAANFVDKALLAEYKTRTKQSKSDDNPPASSRRSSSVSTRTTTNAKAGSSSTRGSPRVSLPESASKSRRLSSGLPNGRASRSNEANNSPASKKRASRSKTRKGAEEEEKESNSGDEGSESVGAVKFEQAKLVAEFPDVVKIPGYLFSMESWDTHLENIDVMVRPASARDLFASLKWKKGVLLGGHTSTEIGLELANEKCPRFMNRFYYTRLRLSKN
ncbi:hypothetical protein BJ741DRAFT_589532 [Chytriomyces cf. hyalinus JEL632]|nr:hypothetical protein BJ741DRAFT_589532 [Chytriomyces cf. hyalinus JEL632]